MGEVAWSRKTDATARSAESEDIPSHGRYGRLFIVVEPYRFAGFRSGRSSPPAGCSRRRDQSPNIALLDVSYIFKNHPRFKAMMEEMKADVERAESDVNKERDTLRKLVEQTGRFPQGHSRLQSHGRGDRQSAKPI